MTFVNRRHSFDMSDDPDDYTDLDVDAAYPEWSGSLGTRIIGEDPIEDALERDPFWDPVFFRDGDGDVR